MTTVKKILIAIGVTTVLGVGGIIAYRMITKKKEEEINDEVISNPNINRPNTQVKLAGNFNPKVMSIDDVMKKKS